MIEDIENVKVEVQDAIPNIEKDHVPVLWLGIILQESEEKEAEAYVANLFEAPEMKLESTYKAGDMHIARFLLPNQNVPRAAILRLQYPDFKWEEDYTQYSKKNGTYIKQILNKEEV